MSLGEASGVSGFAYMGTCAAHARTECEQMACKQNVPRHPIAKSSGKRFRFTCVLLHVHGYSYAHVSATCVIPATYKRTCVILHVHGYSYAQVSDMWVILQVLEHVFVRVAAADSKRSIAAAGSARLASAQAQIRAATSAEEQERTLHA